MRLHVGKRSIALLSAVVASLALAPVKDANSAMFTFGGPAGTPLDPYGGYQCADIIGSSTAAGAAVQAWDCHGGGNQQFTYSHDLIFAMGNTRCWTVKDSNVEGAPITSEVCTAAPNQRWYYFTGQLKNFASGRCLNGGIGTNGTQLRVTSCAANQVNQQVQIK